MDDPGDDGEKAGKAVIIPIIISRTGTAYKDSIKRWNDFVSDIDVALVWMAQSVLHCNVVAVGRYYDKGRRASEMWRRDHPEDFE